MDTAELDRYMAAGFNAMVVFDAEGYDANGTAWNFKTEQEIIAETTFAREHGIPLIIGMATEPFTAAASVGGRQLATVSSSIAPNGTIPQATDQEIRERVSLWQTYGDDVVVGVFPWYDDVFWQHVGVARQKHVYSLIKETAPDWYVFGIIGESGINASEEEVDAYYDTSAFDHLIVLMYPFNVGANLIGYPLDNVASSDPDGDLTRYVDDFFTLMNTRFFSRLRSGQLILLVGQAFHYSGDPLGHIPRSNDVTIMMQRGTQRLQSIAGQEDNYSAAYYWWGDGASPIVGLSQRPDWLAAARSVNRELEQEGRRRVRRQ